MGSRVGAAAVVREPLTTEQLREFCTGRIASFKIPEQLVTVDEIPYNDFGKVDRKVLRSWLEAAVGPRATGEAG
jgi:non-ribosomal peptide synthetase component E (peptide arylation enzyme)